MSNRILLRKLCFLWHLSSLTPDSSLARDMFMFELQHNNMKGLVWELKPHLTNMGVNIEVLNTFTKVQWKAKAKAYIFSKNKSELPATAFNYKKIDYASLCQDDFKLKSYFKTLNMRQASLNFKLISKTMPRVANNMRRDPKYRKIAWACVGCSVGSRGQPNSNTVTEQTDRDRQPPILDTEEHITRCIAYADLAQNRDLNCTIGLVSFFQAVIDRRIEDEENAFR